VGNLAAFWTFWSLLHFTHFEPSNRSCKSVHEFLLQACARIKGTLRKVTERLYFTYSRGIPHPTKFSQNWHMSRIADVISHTKFDNTSSSSRVVVVEFFNKTLSNAKQRMKMQADNKNTQNEHQCKQTKHSPVCKTSTINIYHH